MLCNQPFVISCFFSSNKLKVEGTKIISTLINHAIHLTALDLG